MKAAGKTGISDGVSGKKVYLEALRLLAIIFILYQHQPAYNLFLVSSGPVWWFYAGLSVFTRMNVPMFFMISGALLLPKKEDLKTLFRKRILRHSLVILIFSLIYYILYCRREGLPGGSIGYAAWDFTARVFSNTVEGSEELWFLYAYLGFLLMLPFLRRIAESCTKKDFPYLAVLRLILCSLPPAINLLLRKLQLREFGFSEDFILPLVVFDTFFFTLFGFLLDQTEVSRFKRREWFSLILLLVFSILCPLLFTFLDRQMSGESTQNFIRQFDFVLAGSLFLLVKYLFSEVPAFRRKGLEKTVLFLGSLSFGVYLFDHLLKEVLWSSYYLNVEPYLPTILMSAGWILLSFTICGGAAWLLKKLPGIRSLL